jgi:reverse gyrase
MCCEWFKIKHPKLFIRHFYEPFFVHILGEFDRAKAVERKDKFAILGTPGIGKSAFGMFLLWKALCAGKTVVYVHGTHRQVYIFHSNGRVFEGDFKNWESLPEVKHANNVLLLDAVLDFVERDAFTVFLTSPRDENSKQFRSLHSKKMLYFPMLIRGGIGGNARFMLPGGQRRGSKGSQ